MINGSARVLPEPVEGVSQFGMNQYQQFIHLSRYARWREEDNRRETWSETVNRYIDFFREHRPELSSEVYDELRDAILRQEVMPSMRALMTAGKALERENMAAFNCAFVAVNHPRVFDEILYILMNGTGVGFSVENWAVKELPTVAENFHKTSTCIVVADSKLGWANAFRELISLLYTGLIPTWDMSKVRPAGARLKTFGGRASGPEPLKRLFEFTIATFVGASGRKLTSIECHDIVCKIADIVVVGGVRRSALLSLSDLSDDRMRTAKMGRWWETSVQRALANNSAAYTDKPTIETFLEEWTALYQSKSGERGVFNRSSVQKYATKYGRRDPNHNFGTNPCGEIGLRDSGGLCNLSEVVIRASDTIEDLKRKVRLATILGTIQSTLTNFKYIRNIWKKNAEEERLLGVSLTGIVDNPLTSGRLGKDLLAETLDALREYSIEVNKEFANALGITPSVAITTVKPSGTVSALVDSGSGIHPRYAPYYVRTVRGDMKDPLSKFLYMQGVPCEPDITKPNDIWVFSFPSKSPEGAICRNDLSAIEQLEMYKIYRTHWTEHNVSVTIYVRESEWLDVAAWVYKNFDDLCGVSFLPSDEGKHIYAQAPYQEISKEEYEALSAQMPKIDWSKLTEFETYDTTTGTQELACVGGACEIASAS